MNVLLAVLAAKTECLEEAIGGRGGEDGCHFFGKGGRVQWVKDRRDGTKAGPRWVDGEGGRWRGVEVLEGRVGGLEVSWRAGGKCDDGVVGKGRVVAGPDGSRRFTTGCGGSAGGANGLEGRVGGREGVRMGPRRVRRSRR